jgi:hypothetical protein
MDGLVGHFHMQGVLVGVGIDGDRLDAHAPGGLDDPASDFTAICYQDFLEHLASPGLPIGLIGKRSRALV